MLIDYYANLIANCIISIDFMAKVIWPVGSVYIAFLF